MAGEKREVAAWRKWLSRIITIASAAVFLYAAYNLTDVLIDYYKNHRLMNEMQDIYYAIDDDEPSGDSIRPGFLPLLEQNEETVGWITIEGTKIDYPIVQAEDNFHYLTRNFYHEESRAGSIYLDYRNDIHFDNERNIILYGHRMKDGSMFENLTKYLDKDFFDSNQKIELDTLYDSYEGEVFAVYQTLTTFNYIQTHFDDDAEFGYLLEEIHQASEFPSKVEVTEDDMILTLSTCDYKLDENEGRLVLQAKLTKKT
ncbi:MAG TPA: class B sortase [Pseudogracilibacillus sp.]|nr:class B sortase [Pseudogracilibacillus sp.]